MPDPSTVLVHGVPETAAIWNTLTPLLEPQRVIRLSPPGFGAPIPIRFTATAEECRHWLISELEKSTTRSVSWDTISAASTTLTP